MPSAWVQRLAHYAALSPADREQLEQAASAPRAYAAQESLAKPGEPTGPTFVVLDGLACRFKLLPDGRRQFLAYLFAGDMSDPRQCLAARWDHGMCMLWPGRIVTLSADTIERLRGSAAIARAFDGYALVRQAITREWLVNVGHRTAFERLGHLLCEIDLRLERVGLARNHAFDLPLTQAELGDTLALSAVHVNRTLMEMRRLGLVTFQNRQAAIHDPAALRTAAGFDPQYLQLETAASAAHANGNG
jgi:CRP-like cAMP-binding protein